MLVIIPCPFLQQITVLICVTNAMPDASHIMESRNTPYAYPHGVQGLGLRDINQTIT